MAREKIAIVVNKYAKELRKRGIKPERIILYGSWARGKEREGSDIDLIVISNNLGGMKPLKKLELLSLATAKIGAPIEAFGYTPKEIKEKGPKSIFWDIIEKTGKTVYPT